MKTLLVMSATNAVIERPVSNLHRIKDWPRTSMTLKIFKHCMILSVHTESTDNLHLIVVANDIFSGKDKRWNTFGNFQQKDLKGIEWCKLKIYFGD